MRSFTSSEGPQLVRIAVLCAQIMVAIEMHWRATRFERPASRPPRLEQRERRGLFFLIHSLVVDSTERHCCHCNHEFEQLLLTCIEGCGL